MSDAVELGKLKEQMVKSLAAITLEAPYRVASDHALTVVTYTGALEQALAASQRENELREKRIARLHERLHLAECMYDDCKRCAALQEVSDE